MPLRCGGRPNPRRSSICFRPPERPTRLQAKRKSTCTGGVGKLSKCALRAGMSKQLPLKVTQITAADEHVESLAVENARYRRLEERPSLGLDVEEGSFPLKLGVKPPMLARRNQLRQPLRSRLRNAALDSSIRSLTRASIRREIPTAGSVAGKSSQVRMPPNRRLESPAGWMPWSGCGSRS